MERRSQRGVTLIELLVVMAILALTTMIVVLSAPPVRGPAKDEAERFAARLSAALESAVIAGGPLRLDVTRTGYRFWRFEDGEWAPASAPLAPRLLAREVALAVESADAAFANEPKARMAEDDARHILLDATGMAEPFAVDFADARARWRVSLGALGEIEVAANAR
ncbi:MAG: type II secretion system minor pseudopilin GspH [Amphiplicatus sp.]